MRNVLRIMGIVVWAALLGSLAGAQKARPRGSTGGGPALPVQVLDENGLRLGITIASFPVTTAVVGELYQYQVVVTDNCSGVQTYGYVLASGPAGLDLNPTTGLLSWVPQPTDVGLHDISIRITTAGGALCPTTPRDAQNFTLEVVSLPEDPEETASPPDPTGSFYDETSFLWDGSSGIQTGVDPATIDPTRVSVLRGFVFDRDSGLPLSGVRMTVVDHPEFGQTLTRANGEFDLAVNGGTPLTLSFLRGGYLELQRTRDIPVNTYICFADAYLVMLDVNVTEVLLGQNPGVEVVMGSVITDSAGTRQARVIFPSGISAELQAPGGGTQPILRIHARATEYSVGVNGSASLPGSLPPGMGYTYAVELSADEVSETSSSRIQFSDGLPLYVENFLDFDVGTQVAAAYYDPLLGVWVPSPDGLVVEILSISAEGLANLDLDGDGLEEEPEVYASTGIGEGERMSLGEMFGPAQELTRVEIDHFTAWTIALPVGATSSTASSSDQGAPRFGGNDLPGTPSTGGGSLLEFESQTLGQRVRVAGTPYSLHYRSDRTPGWDVSKSISGPLIGPSVPAGLAEIRLSVEVMGEIQITSFPASPDQGFEFVWDGFDPYGRATQGGQQASVSIGYVYDGSYYCPLDVAQSFGMGSGNITANPSREDVVLQREYRSSATQRVRAFGAWDQRALGLGGWSLSAHHAYDPDRRTLYLGDGRQLSVANVFGPVIETVAGNGVNGFSGDGGPATEASFSGAFGNATRSGGIDVGPDGSVYFADFNNHRVRRVAPDGTISTFAGNGTTALSGDGGPAVDAGVRQPIDVAVTNQGGLLIASFGHGRIRHVDRDGIITTVAGNGGVFSGPDGVPATQSGLPDVTGVAIAYDGSILVTDVGRLVRRIDNSGIIQTVAGSGTGVPGEGDGGPATEAGLGSILGVDTAPDGSFYMANDNTFIFGGGNKIRRVEPTGLIDTVAGTGSPGFSGDGGPALAARFDRPTGVVVTPEYSMYVTEEENDRIRFVDASGTINTIAGTNQEGFSGDGGPALRAEISNPTAIACGPDGELYFIDQGNFRIRRIRQVLPGSSLTDIFVPSEDGAELYRFDANGRHLTTLNSANGAVLLTFAYDSEGRLASMVDADGNTTTINRDVNGDPTGIVGPHGQLTLLTLDPNGFLETITNPDGDQYEFGYGARGLMLSMDDPNDNSHSFAYDSLGRLMTDSDPAGGAQSLARTENAGVVSVTRTTALGRVTTFQYETLPTLDRMRTVLGPGGTQVQEFEGADGISSRLLPDGTEVELTRGPDARFGMDVPRNETIVVTLPSNTQLTATRSEAVTLADPDDPTSVVSSTTQVTLNGNTNTYAFDAASSTLTRTTPMGRQSTIVMDATGRALTRTRAGLADVDFFYDGNGRLMQVSQGTGPGARVTTLTYDGTSGFLDTLTDPELGATSFTRDPAGRVTQVSAPGPRIVGLSYDDNGNVLSVTPPGRPVHTFGTTPVDLNSLYTPPAIGLPTPQTAFAYNTDRQLELVTLPDGSLVDPAYDGITGRLLTEAAPSGTTTFGYDPGTGQLTSIATPAGDTVAYQYDGFLLSRATWSGTIAGYVGRTYTDDFNVATHDVGGTVIAYAYDADGLLTGAGALTLSRDPATGFLTGTTLGAVTDTFVYNAFGEVSSYAAQASAANVLTNVITRDRLGAVTQVAETLFATSQTFDYTYDAAGRLDTVTLNSVQISDYDYDANGNRTLHTSNGSTMVAATYDDQDRLLTYGTATYTYGDNGELATRTDGTDVTTYSYDVYGNLSSVVLPDTTVIGYVHDANNRRIGRSVNSVLTRGFLYKDGLNPIAELNGSGTVVSLFVYGTKSHVPDAMISGGVTYRIISDHLGSVRAVVHSGTGVVVQQLDYDEFGVVLTDTNPGFQPFGFAGGLYDPSTGLVRFGARDYDAEVGRWTAKDPLGFGGGANHYAYVGNNPTSFIDPTGLVRWGQSHDGPAQYAGGPDAFRLGILAARAGYGAAAMVPLAAANGYGADADVPAVWSGILGASYDALLPGGVAEAAGSSLPGGGNTGAAKWLGLARLSGAPELGELSAPSPLWKRALDLLRLSDGVSQTPGDVGGPLREQLATDLSK